MMKRSILGIALASAFAIAAIAAASASAASPEWGQCYEKAGGKYTNSNCTTKGKGGNWEWRKGTAVVNKGFTAEAGTGILTSTFIICEPNAKRTPGSCASKGEEETKFGPITVECKAEHGHGVASGKDGVESVSVKFTGCVALGSIPCSNTPTEGEIETNTLKGTLGYISASKKEVGVDLTPAAKHGEFAKFACAIGLTTVVGVGNSKEGTAYAGSKGGGDGIISPITPIDQMTNEFTQVYTINAEEENIPNKFEGKSLQVLEAYLYNSDEPQLSSKWSKSGETITNVNHPEEEVEIKA